VATDWQRYGAIAVLWYFES